MVVENTEEQMERVLSAYGTLLIAVPSFNYLGKTLSSSDDDWTAVEQNICRERRK